MWHRAVGVLVGVVLVNTRFGWRIEAVLIETARGVIELARSFPFDVDLWRAQNAFYRMLQTEFARQSSPDWLAAFRELGDRLGVRVPPSQERSPSGRG